MVASEFVLGVAVAILLLSIIWIVINREAISKPGKLASAKKKLGKEEWIDAACIFMTRVLPNSDKDSFKTLSEERYQMMIDDGDYQHPSVEMDAFLCSI